MASLLYDMIRLFITSYYFIACGESGFVYSSFSRCIRCRVFYFLVQSLIFDMYLSWPLRWCILSVIASEDLVGRFRSPKASEWNMLIHRSLWSKDGPWLNGI